MAIMEVYDISSNTGSSDSPISQAIQGCIILPNDKCRGNKAFLELIEYKARQCVINHLYYG